MHTAFKHFRRTLRTTNTLQRNPNPNSSLNRSQHHAAKMPLVVPGVTADNMSSDKVNEWMNKLAGKTISEEPSSETTFCRTELPQATRVIAPGAMMTRDFNPDRLNVYVKDDGTVSHVSQG